MLGPPVICEIRSKTKLLQEGIFFAHPFICKSNFITKQVGETKATNSEAPNRQADRNKRAGLEKTATLLTYLLSKLINEQGGIFRLLHEKLRAG